MKLSTICVQAAPYQTSTEPHQLPLYATSSFAFKNLAEGVHAFQHPHEAHIYARFSNPTIDAVADKIARLEAYETGIEAWGMMTSSGMSAIATLLMGLLKNGDKILSQGNLYGGTTELLKRVMGPQGIEVIWTNLRDLSAVKNSLENTPDITIVYLETPSNPALDCIDIQAISDLAKEYGVLTVVDNTFCTPAIQQPFKFGADVIIHSTTKYLNGHGNGISGIIIGRDQVHHEAIWGAMKLVGTNCNPWDAWLVNNGLRTLSLRMERHSENGQQLADYLSTHPKVESVRYLGLTTHPDHALAKRQMNSFGGMLAFELKGGIAAGKKLMDAVRLASLAPTMGDVDTLLLHPASMSHLKVPREMRLANGITDGLVRVSVGIEHIDDIIHDFQQALDSL